MGSKLLRSEIDLITLVSLIHLRYEILPRAKPKTQTAIWQMIITRVVSSTRIPT